MPKLSIQRPDEAPMVHELSVGVATVGRDADNAIVIPDDSVSRHHAEIVFNGEICILRDLSSANGTAVNYDPVTEIPLKNGDIVHFGLMESILVMEPFPVARKPESAPPVFVPPTAVDIGGAVAAPTVVEPSPVVEPPVAAPPVVAPPPVVTAPVIPPSPRVVVVPVATPPPVVTPPAVAPSPKPKESKSPAPLKNPPASGDVSRSVVMPLTPEVQAHPPAKRSEAVAPVKTPSAKADAGLSKPVSTPPVVEPPPVPKKPETVAPVKTQSAQVDVSRSSPVRPAPVVGRSAVPKKSESVAPVIITPSKHDAVRPDPISQAPAIQPVPKPEKPAPVVPSPANRAVSQADPVPLTPVVKPLRTVEGSGRETPAVVPSATKRRLVIYTAVGLLVVLAGGVFLLRRPRRQEVLPQKSAAAKVYNARSTKDFWDKIQQIEAQGNQHGKDVDFGQYPKLPSGLFNFARFDNDAFEGFLVRLSQRSQIMNQVADDLGSLDKNGVDADLISYTDNLRGQWKGGAVVDIDYGLLVAGLQEQKRRFTSDDAVELRKFDTSMGNDSLEREFQQNQEHVRGLVSRWAAHRDAHVDNTAKVIARQKEIGRLLTERYKMEFK